MGSAKFLHAKQSLLTETSTSFVCSEWRSEGDKTVRSHILSAIILVLKSRIQKLSPENPIENSLLNKIALRLELGLYQQAASLGEYANLQSIMRRLQGLVVKFHEADSRLLCFSGLQFKKRSLEVDDVQSNEIEGSRCKLRSPRVCIDNNTQKTNIFRSRPASTFLIYDQVDLITQMYSFLPGIEVVKHSRINSFAYRVIPKCIRSFWLTPTTLQKCCSGSPIESILSRYPYLIEIVVVESNQSHLANSSPWERFFDEPNQQIVASVDKKSSTAVCAFARILRNGTCRKLERLALNCMLSTHSSLKVRTSVIKALGMGACPSLKKLALNGNSLSDAGVAYVADLIASDTCPNLEFVDLRRNFIGEAGAVALAKAFEMVSCPRMKVICLGGNILNDSSVVSLATSISRSCPSLLHLGVEYNFFGNEGKTALNSLKHGRIQNNQNE